MVTRSSCCKVNLLLNILGRREDGFHELESVMLPVPLTDTLTFEDIESGVELACSHPGLPVDERNLAWRAAARFLEATGGGPGIRIHLEKRLPLAAGIGGGSANAAVVLRAMNELRGNPLDAERLNALAAGLGSDVPFFLQDGPALATGRGERIQPLSPFSALRGCGMVLLHPGFGVSTPWAYTALREFPEALNGRPGRAAELVEALEAGDLVAAGGRLFNSLEAPVLRKYPLLAELQDFFRAEGAWGALMSGSGSTTFALTRGLAEAERARQKALETFGPGCWTAAVEL